MKEILVDKIQGHLLPIFPALLLGVSVTTRALAVTNEWSGMIRTQMEKHNISVLVTMNGIPCVIPPCKQ
jgi:hypothetical protein